MSDVLFKLPNEKTVMRNTLHDEPEEFMSLSHTHGRSGYVIAPFAVSESAPLLIIPAKWEKLPLLPLPEMAKVNLYRRHCEADRERYGVDFRKFHAKLTDKTFKKIVLARRSTIYSDVPIEPKALFAQACSLYPGMFVSLFSSEKSGTWLIATPEKFISGKGCKYSTMALAGTTKAPKTAMNTGEHMADNDIPTNLWSEKNRAEQHYVEEYITDCITRHTKDIAVNGPYTTKAGSLLHLRSDICFGTSADSCIYDIAETLHPTPAVCGIPKAEAMKFISDNESANRQYYSGFSGILNQDSTTELFVTLRCMKISGCKYELYAGGGLLEESREQSEWEETEAKMETMMSVLRSVGCIRSKTLLCSNSAFPAVDTL